MAGVKLTNVDRFIDRHGKPRHYFRKGRGARVRLPGTPDSAEFMRAYEEAARHDNRQPVATQPTTTAQGSCVEWSGVPSDPPEVWP